MKNYVVLNFFFFNVYKRLAPPGGQFTVHGGSC
jgi:hypothetical protein